jgi:tetratricopeptide (TPR) repeat protein
VQEKGDRAPPKYWRAASAVVALACLATAYYALRLAYAEYLFRRGQPDTLERAAHLIPSQANYQARLSRLQRAVELNPYFAAAWMEIGAGAESQSDYSQAERALREAARVDRTFEPSWVLANFYFRRQNWDEFWKWIRAAADMSYGDRSALFRLCWQATGDPEIVLHRAIPSERVILGDYVYFLVNSERFVAAQDAARKWLPVAAKADLFRLLLLCDILIERVHTAPAALEIWNALIARGWLPYQRLDPEAGASLTNGAFRAPPADHGFDWRLLPRPGIRSVRTEPPGLLITFDGRESEQTEVLLQWIPTRPSSAYELSIHSQSRDVPAGSGLRWQVVNGASGVSLAESGSDLPLETLRFEAPPQCSLAKLVLGYRRAAGTTRIAGSLVLSSVTLRLRTP